MTRLAQVLVVMDMQEGYSDCYEFDELVEKINDRISEYREEGHPIIFIQNVDKGTPEGSKEWKIAKKLDYQSGDMTVQKHHLNAFYRTELNDLLSDNDLEQLEICGVETEYCCNATITMAHGLGYQVEMIPGMTTTEDNEQMTAQETIDFYENIWGNHFLRFI
ncbi:isochorismatase family protein [Companilactobacillus mishanensis]|uniref:Isochorismatase family protein n=1 Tax=Companilactobacillus mishanensis TaxID=2486008 RepID=A0ABW9P7R7_9LACO|nr:isochorismatase family protein [Companilactobacillus mishanensis]MQS45315.1 isochorismatase family protein [Companilactobacillus mishanensis]